MTDLLEAVLLAVLQHSIVGNSASVAVSISRCLLFVFSDLQSDILQLVPGSSFLCSHETPAQRSPGQQ